jgi:hypothetical protein
MLWWAFWLIVICGVGLGGFAFGWLYPKHTQSCSNAIANKYGVGVEYFSPNMLERLTDTFENPNKMALWGADPWLFTMSEFVL